MMKILRFTGLFMVLAALTIFLSSPAMAAESDGQAAAEYLYELGLFRGTGTDSTGAPVFELDRSPTRAEALVMLLRLMGLEQEALNSGYTHPFTDVSGWNEPYIAYAYNKGITKGVSETRFGANEKATASMYITFVLRALGYTDTGDSPDFSYSGSVSFAVGIGLADDGLLENTDFTRGDVAVISRNALSQTLRGSGKTLFQRLADDGVIENIPYENGENAPGGKRMPYWNEDGTVLMVPVENAEEMSNFIYRETLLHYFPEMTKVLYPTISESFCIDPFGVMISDRYSITELMFIDALSYEKHYNRYGWTNGDKVRLISDRTLFLVDDSYNILAICTIPQGDMRLDEIAFYTDVEIDGAKLNSDYHRIVDTVSENWGKNVFELGEERYDPWNNGPHSSYIRFVKMNGEYVSDGWYCLISEYNPQLEIHPIEAAEQAMTSVFFFSDNVLIMEDSDGNRIYTNYHFSEGLLVSKYKSVDDPDAPASRGFWFAEHSNWPRVIYFFTRDGVYLGQINVPAS
ncbi:MAG TPA: S-layer homology domain-containing protein [Clostridiales bacterium]|nr:S-layer homology domain-containing protein [Clostridiales bacterium]